MKRSWVGHMGCDVISQQVHCLTIGTTFPRCLSAPMEVDICTIGASIENKMNTNGPNYLVMFVLLALMLNLCA